MQKPATTCLQAHEIYIGVFMVKGTHQTNARKIPTLIMTPRRSISAKHLVTMGGTCDL